VSEPLEIQPGFWRAFKGIWSFTWRSRVTLWKLPIIAAVLLFIPALVYFVVDRTEVDKDKSFVEIQPAKILNNYRMFAEGKKRPPSAEKVVALKEILANELKNFSFQPEDANKKRYSITEILDHQLDQLKAYQTRVVEKFKAVPQGFNEYRDFYNSLDADIAQIHHVARQRWSLTVMPFYVCLIDLYFFIILPLYCLSVAGALIRDELQSDTLGFLITRPVSRASLFTAKFLTLVIWIQLILLIHTLLLFAAGYLKGVPDLTQLLGLFLAVQIVSVFVWSALSSLLGLFFKRYLVIGILYGILVEQGIGRIPTNINSLSMTRHLKALLSNNSTLDSIHKWSEDFVAFKIFEWTPPQNLFAVGALLLAGAIFLGLGIILFTFREFNSSDEMQK
jgi:ABC-type transport system involved in multi-copper enzyme maturation permease subunit